MFNSKPMFASKPVDNNTKFIIHKSPENKQDDRIKKSPSKQLNQPKFDAPKNMFSTFKPDFVKPEVKSND